MFISIKYFGLTFLLLVFACARTEWVYSGPEYVDGIKVPKVKYYEELEYPQLAHIGEVEGYVRVLVSINKEGKVVRSEVTGRRFNYDAVLLSDGTYKFVEELFDPLAIDFTNKLIFEPAIKDGQPIDYTFEMPINWGIMR